MVCYAVGLLFYNIINMVFVFLAKQSVLYIIDIARILYK